MNKYEVLGVVGEGAYGVVLRCRNKDSGTVVAVKKFKESEDDEIVKKTTLREVKVLRMLRHPNIVCLKEAFRRKGKLYLVFEYVDKNLLEVLEDHPDGLPFEAVRGYIHQLCRAIDWCHHNGVVHRDIKPENLLVNPTTNELKLCDFGFARTIPPSSAHQQDLTDYVATRWYRAPELLLGSTRYDPSVDIWAIGCIMGELVDGQPLFPGDSEIDQLYIVQRMLGPLTEAHLQLFLKNPRFVGLKFPDMSHPETLQKRFVGKLGKRAMAFMRGALTMDPVERLSSREALCHSLFEGLFEDYVDRYPHLQQSQPQQQHHHHYQEEADFQGGWNRDQDKEDWRRSGGGGGGSDQKLTTQHTRDTTGESSHGGDDRNLACRPNPPSGGVPRLGRFVCQSSQQSQRQLQQQQQQSGWEPRSRGLGGGRGGNYGHRRGSGSSGQSNATRHRDRPAGRDYGSKGMSLGGAGGRESRRTGGRGGRNAPGIKGRYVGERGEGGYGGGGGREDRSACPTNGGQSVGGSDANYNNIVSGEPHPVISNLYQSSNHTSGGGSLCRNRENENPGSSPSAGGLYENDVGVGGGNYYGSSFNARASPHQHQTHHNSFYQQRQTRQQAPPSLYQHQQPAPSSREGHQHQWHHDESGGGTGEASPQLLPGFSGSRNFDGDDSERKGYGRDSSREGRDRASRDLRERDSRSYRDGGVGDGCRERSRGDFGRNTSREANREIGGGGGRRGPTPLKGLQAEPKASPRREGKASAGDGVNGMSNYHNGGGMDRSMATTGKASDGKPAGTRRWKGDGGTGGAQNIAEEKRQHAREIQAERERQRESEIRAFRDFSNHLACSSNKKSAGIHDFGEEDIDFRRGAPKRAEHKAAAVSLDALKDPTLVPRSRGRDDPSSRRDYTAAAGGGLVSSGNAGRRLFGPGIGEPGSGGNGCDNMNIKQGFQQGFGGESGGIGPSPSLMSARYPPLEHIQNPPQPDPKAVADMDKFPGPHPGAVAKPSAFSGYPISPLHMKRRGSSNPGVGAIEEKLEAKRGLGVGIDAADARYLPQLRRNEGRCDAHHSSSGY